MESYFNELAAAADRALGAGERHTLAFAAEDTDFVRMNRGKVRQPGHVTQRYADDIGADGYSDNAAAAVALARKLCA